jgi:hypothetical protein
VLSFLVSADLIHVGIGVSPSGGSSSGSTLGAFRSGVRAVDGPIWVTQRDAEMSPGARVSPVGVHIDNNKIDKLPRMGTRKFFSI